MLIDLISYFKEYVAINYYYLYKYQYDIKFDINLISILISNHYLLLNRHLSIFN